MLTCTDNSPDGLGVDGASGNDYADLQSSSPNKSNRKRNLPSWMLNLSQGESSGTQFSQKRTQDVNDTTRVKKGKKNAENESNRNKTAPHSTNNATTNVSLNVKKIKQLKNSRNTTSHGISDSDSSEDETNSMNYVKNTNTNFKHNEVESITNSNNNCNMISSESKEITGGLGNTTSHTISDSEAINRDKNENCMDPTKNVESKSMKNGSTEDDQIPNSSDNQSSNIEGESKSTKNGSTEDDQIPNSSDNQLSPNIQGGDGLCKQRCRYGGKCYRKNAQHLKDFSHPGDKEYDTSSNDTRPECEYGTACYRKNPLHRQHYTHTKRPAAKKKQETASGSSDDDYDYDDPFLNDGSSDDYDPTDTDSDSDNSDNDNGEEEKDSKRMKKEAKRFLRKKKS